MSKYVCYGVPNSELVFSGVCTYHTHKDRTMYAHKSLKMQLTQSVPV